MWVWKKGFWATAAATAAATTATSAATAAATTATAAATTATAATAAVQAAATTAATTATTATAATATTATAAAATTATAATATTATAATAAVQAAAGSTNGSEVDYFPGIVSPSKRKQGSTPGALLPTTPTLNPPPPPPRPAYRVAARAASVRLISCPMKNDFIEMLMKQLGHFVIRRSVARSSNFGHYLGEDWRVLEWLVSS